MTQDDDSSLNSPSAEALDRFLRAHPDGGKAEFESWAATQQDLQGAPDLRSAAEHLLDEWLGAAKLLALGFDSDDGGSVFRRRRATPNEGAGPSGATEALQQGRKIGSFTLTRFIARGGMGQVWEAHDEELRRTVALKLVLPDRIDERSLELFAREARAGGRLNHPNLVTTLAYGTDDGLAWIAQELVEGSWTVKDSLDALRADDSVPKEYYREVAELVARIADGMQAVHDAGVIHRDLKPQNILIADDDTPKVTDFGLARVTDDSVLSQSGDFAGTWAYMSPEQVTAKRMGLDHRTDVFSLGVVMYELLTLRKPFEGDTTHQIAQEIIYADPPDATKVRSQCPGELSVIAGKAMEKVPGNRYGSMAELASDLRRHLANEPVLAKPPGAVARGAKWVRRHPAISSAGAVALIALLGLSWLLIDNLRANRSLDARSVELQLALERSECLRLLGLAQGVLEDDPAAALLLALEAARGPLRREVDGVLRQVLEVLHEEQSFSSPELGAVAPFGFFPDSRRFWLVRRDGISVHDAGSGDRRGLIRLSQTPIQVAVAPSSELLAILTKEGEIEVFDALNYERVASPGGREPVSLFGALRFDSRGERLAVARTDVAIFDVGSEEEVFRTPISGVITVLDFSPDGERFLIADGKSVSVLQTGTYDTLGKLDHDQLVFDAHFGDSGRTVITRDQNVDDDSSAASSAFMWSLRGSPGHAVSVQLAQQAGLPDPGFGVAMPIAGGEVERFQISDDRRTVVVATRGGTVVVQRVGRKGRTTWKVPGEIAAMDLSADGKRVVVACFDGVVEVRETEGGSLVAPLRGHRGTAAPVSLSPDGQHVLTRGMDDGTAKLWWSHAPHRTRIVPGEPYDSFELVFAGDGRALIALGGEGGLRVLSVDEPGREIQTADRHTFALMDRGLLAVPDENGVAVMDPLSGTTLKTIEGPLPWILACDAVGQRLAAGADETIRVFDLETEQLVEAITTDSGNVNSLSMSPDGERLAASFSLPTDQEGFVGFRWLNTLLFADATSGEAIASLEGHEGGIREVKFSGNGRWLFVNDGNGVTVYRAADGVEVRRFRRLDRFFDEAYPDPAGNRLVAISSATEEILVWSVEDGGTRVIEVPKGLDAFPAAWSSGGDLFATASGDKVLLRETSNFDVIGELPRLGSQVNSIAFSPDGRWVATSSWDGAIRMSRLDVLADAKDLAPRDFSMDELYEYQLGDVQSRDGLWQLEQLELNNAALQDTISERKDWSPVIRRAGLALARDRHVSSERALEAINSEVVWLRTQEGGAAALEYAELLRRRYPMDETYELWYAAALLRRDRTAEAEQLLSSIDDASLSSTDELLSRLFLALAKAKREPDVARQMIERAATEIGEIQDVGVSVLKLLDECKALTK